jgi:hypothetical protein
MKSKKQALWSDVKASLNGFDRNGLIGIIRNLYEASSSNRRFLHARFVPAAAPVDEYRDLVRAAVFPDPLSQRPIRLRDATAAIAEYKRSTGDLGGVVDLLLTFVEAGTEQAADLGYGDDAYFATLERKVNEAVAALDALPDAARGDATSRLVRLGEYQDYLEWGYSDFLGNVAATLQARHAVQVVRSVATRSNKRIKPARAGSRARAAHS